MPVIICLAISRLSARMRTLKRACASLPCGVEIRICSHKYHQVPILNSCSSRSPIKAKTTRITWKKLRASFLPEVCGLFLPEDMTLSLVRSQICRCSFHGLQLHKIRSGEGVYLPFHCRRAPVNGRAHCQCR